MDVGTYCFAALRWACTSFSRQLIFMRVSSDCLRPVALPCIAYRVPVRMCTWRCTGVVCMGLRALSISLQTGMWRYADMELGHQAASCLPRLCLSPSRACAMRRECSGDRVLPCSQHIEVLH